MISNGQKKTVVVTGASRGLGASITQAFLDRGYNVVANSRGTSKNGFAPSPGLALVDGDTGHSATAERVVKLHYRGSGRSIT